MKIAITSLMLLVVTVPAMAQTTGTPLYNDFTINGTGSSMPSMVATNIQGGLSMEISGLSGSGVIGAISPTAAIGGVPLGSGTVDISLGQATFFVDATGGLAPNNPWNAFAQTDANGQWSVAVNASLPVGVLGHIQYGIAGPGYPGGTEVTQAHTVTNTALLCAGAANPGPNGDDSTLQVLIQNGLFTFYGTAYSDLWINSNGNITFVAGDTDFTSTEAEFLANNPRIAPCWDDFSPNVAGAITYQEDPATGTVTVVFNAVPHFASTGDANTFCAILDLVAGGITMSWDTMGLGLGLSVDTLVGIGPGGGISPANNIDLSAPFPGINATDAVYEDFAQLIYSPFDLALQTKTFFPGGGPGTGPYSVF
ncbi:MAG: hypothetical protein CMJ90_05705 [Planctomycetes bacterium]|nr:hypothetical protein [Planctomycetota bacterium]